MAKKNKKREFELYQGLYPTDRHIRKTRFMLHHPNYIDLSPNAKVLYDYMTDWAIGKKQVTFAYSLVSKLMAKTTYLRARDNLIEQGFIKYINRHCAEDLRQPGIYEFSSDWVSKPNKKANVKEYNSTYSPRVY